MDRWMWIFGQTPWNDADQNLTIHTHLLTRHDVTPAWEWCQPRPCPVSPATHDHEALPHHCCHHRHRWTGRMLSGQSTNKTSRHLLWPLWHVIEARVVGLTSFACVACHRLAVYLSKQVVQLSQRDHAAVSVSCGQISMLFSVFKEHCCRLLSQSVSPVNRQRLKCHRMQRQRANGWFTSRTKFVFKGMSPTNYLCTDR